jgi:hypothetical protein
VDTRASFPDGKASGGWDYEQYSSRIEVKNCIFPCNAQVQEELCLDNIHITVFKRNGEEFQICALQQMLLLRSKRKYI